MKKKKKAQHLAEFEPTTTNMKAIAISAAVQPLPLEIIVST